jgi:MATE family multidrug resistance protein
MTTCDKVERPPKAEKHGAELSRELAETIRLAAPMALTQLGHIAMMTTDLAFIGRLGGDAIAAAALAGTVYWISFTVGMGCCRRWRRLPRRPLARGKRVWCGARCVPAYGRRC